MSPSQPASTGRSVIVQRMFDASASAIFDLITDIGTHSLIDGSAMLQGSPQGPQRLELGSRFSLAMKQAGMGYRSQSRVVEFEQDRLLVWETGAEFAGRMIVGGQRWSYALQPRDGGTLVRHGYDLSTANGSAMLVRLGYLKRMTPALERTLVKLEELVASAGREA